MLRRYHIHIDRTDLRKQLPLLLAALLALAWVIARARLQSVSLDEASSYELFAAPEWPSCWYPSSGNHVLNSIFERAFTQWFGLSELTLRLPALLGAELYIAASYGLCMRIGGRPAVRWPLFLCLVYNPFVMDYMVAARGYSLALGFLLAAVWAMWDSRFATASVCVALSFCANFSFAYIDAAVILLFAFCAARRERSWRVLALSLVPGGLTALICGRTVWRWPKGQLYYGARSLREMWESVASATFDDLNPHLAPPALALRIEPLRTALAYILVAVLLWQLSRIMRAGHPLGLILSRAMAAAFLCHWLAFRVLRIPLPLARTAIFFVPLSLLLIGIGAALPFTGRAAVLSRFMSAGVLSLCALYFIACLRLSHFKEWKFDADVRETFGVLQAMHRRSEMRDIEIDWRYSAPLNFYRVSLRERGMAAFEWTEPHVEGKPAYVLYYPTAEEFIRKQQLRIVYRGRLSDVVVAVR